MRKKNCIKENNWPNEEMPMANTTHNKGLTQKEQEKHREKRVEKGQCKQNTECK